jgi:hypothetical protein
MFRLLLCHHQVSVSVKALNLYPMWICIVGCLYTIQYRTCNKTISVMCYLKCNDTYSTVEIIKRRMQYGHN